MKIYIYIFLAIILSLNYKAHSQNNKLEIINSNITVYDSSKNPDYRRLVDSVIFKHDNAIINSLTADLLSNEHSISENWEEKHNIFTERENEIQKFKPQEYWSINIQVYLDNKEKIEA